MKLKEPFAVFSNLVFLAPLSIGIKESLFIHALIIFLVFIFSTIFHIIKPPGIAFWVGIKTFNKNQKVFFWIDIVVANILIIFNLFMFWQADFPIEFWYAVITTVIAFSFFFFPNKRPYDFSEGIWHMLAGLVTLFAVII